MAIVHYIANFTCMSCSMQLYSVLVEVSSEITDMQENTKHLTIA